MTPADIHLVIASVPWRADNLDVLLRSARSQGVQQLTLILDGYSSSYLPPIKGFNARIVRLQAHPFYSGAGFRALFMCASQSPLVCTLDDDLGIDNNYFNCLIRAVKSSGGSGAFAWSGVSHLGEFIRYSSSLKAPVKLFGPQFGALFMINGPAKQLLNFWISKFRTQYPKYLSREFGGELFIGASFWSINLPVVRPAGCAPLHMLNSLGKDNRSFWCINMPVKGAQFQEIRKLLPKWYVPALDKKPKGWCPSGAP